MAALAERRRACAGWLAWATALVAALWIQVVPRTPGRSMAIALVLTAGMAGAAGLAVLGRGLRRSHLAPFAGAVFLGAVVLSGTLGPWLGALAVPGMAAGLGLLLARLWLGPTCRSPRPSPSNGTG